jgi:pYEATS domain-containing protein involved in immunity
MTDADKRRASDQLSGTERAAAGIAAAVLLVIAVWMVVDPPDRTQALGGCRSATDGCLVTVDGDLTTIAAALFALAAAAGLIGLLGVRFTSVKAAGVELATDGLPKAPDQDELPSDDEELGIDTQGEEPPVRVIDTDTTPHPVVSLPSPMDETPQAFLRDYRRAVREGQRDWYLTHILGPATSRGQKYSVAIKVTPHKNPPERVTAARFFFGRAWGYQVFNGKPGDDGRFGITTEAHGPFLVLCEVEFANGDRVLLDHYCDFEMGKLVDEQAR